MAKQPPRGRLALFWGAVTLGMLLLAALFPLSGDDWQLGAARELFQTFNGRYLGNTLVVLLVQTPALRPFVVGATMSFIAYAVGALAGLRAQPVWGLLLAFVIPMPMFLQVYPWTAGFCNFTVSTALLLLGFLLWQRAERAGRSRWLWCGLILLVSLATQFFAEHITVAATLMSLTVVLYSAAKRRLHRPALFALIGHAAGAVLMFENNAYTLGETPAGVHDIPSLWEIPYKVLANFSLGVGPQLFLESTMLNLGTLVFLVLLLKNAPRAVERGWLGGRADRLMLGYVTLYCAYSALRQVFTYFEQLRIFRYYIDAVLAGLYVLCLVLLLWRNLPAGRHRQELFFTLLLLAYLLLPLLATHTGYRCTFVCYLIWGIALLRSFMYARAEGWLRTDVRLPRAAAAALVLVSFLSCLVIYGSVFRDVRARDAYVQEQLSVESNVIEVYAIRQTDYIWQANPISDYTAFTFKRFFGVPQEREIRMVYK